MADGRDIDIEGIINEIAEYENVAKRVFEEGKAEADRIIADAEKQGKELLESKRKEAEAKAAKILKKARENAEKRHIEIVRVTEEKIANLKATYAGLKDGFIDSIIREIFNFMK